MASFEVEVKSLLGNPENAETIRTKMKQLDSSTKLLSRNTQLNHYFIGGDIQKLSKKAQPILSQEAHKQLLELSESAKDSSVRTRDKDGAAFLVVKASVDDTTSSNGIARREFEEKIALSLSELDALVISAGYAYQAKWSREREEYVCNGTNVTLDRNAGYGWLAEFERMVESQTAVAAARSKIDDLMKTLGVDELPQDRLERMFAFYNAHWPEYYGTDKIFIVE